MKKVIKTMTILLLFISIIGIVYAGTDSFTLSGTLENTIIGNNVTRKPITGTATFGERFKTSITSIENVKNLNNGTNANGGIRVFTTVKRKVGLVWWGIGEKQTNIYYKNSKYNTDPLVWEDSGTKETKIEWQNRTGNTSFHANFNGIK